MGILFGGWANDPWEIARQERIAEIGQEAYDKEVEAYKKKYKEEHPEQYRWSATEPKVMYGDIIVRYQKEPFKVLEEMRVTGIDEQGNIWGRMVTNNPGEDPRQGAEYMWEGEYAKLNY